MIVVGVAVQNEMKYLRRKMADLHLVDLHKHLKGATNKSLSEVSQR